MSPLHFFLEPQGLVGLGLAYLLIQSGQLGNNNYRYRRNYRERHGVGGWLGATLTSSEFEILLGLLCLSMFCSNCFTQDGLFRQHPICGIAMALMMYVQFQIPILQMVTGKSRRLLGHRIIWPNTDQNYSFQPHAVYQLRDYYRIFTGQLLHSNALHLYLNMCSFSQLMRIEHRFSGSLQFLLFLVSVVLLTGVCFVGLVYNCKPSAKRTYAVGFSGVLFALKAMLNAFAPGIGSIRIPVYFDIASYTIPIVVPRMMLHWCELAICSFIFPQVSFWGHLAGIMVGYIFALGVRFPALIDCGMVCFRSWTSRSTTKGKPTLGQAFDMMIKGMSKILTADAFGNQHGSNGRSGNEQTMHQEDSSATFDEDEDPPMLQLPGSADAAVSTEHVVMQQYMFVGVLVTVLALFAGYRCLSRGSQPPPSQDPGVVTEETETAPTLGRSPKSQASSPSSLSQPQQEPSSPSGIHPQFDAALDQLLERNINKRTVAQSLRTLHQVIDNAITLGQEDGGGKYLRVRAMNPSIKAKVVDVTGAMAILFAVGFSMEYVEKEGGFVLIYPRVSELGENASLPIWVGDALNKMKDLYQELEATNTKGGGRKQAAGTSDAAPEPPTIDASPTHDPKDIRLARLAKLTNSNKKKTRRTGGPGGAVYGFGGGDVSRVFYQNGT